jgi:cysteine desulfurase family protein (TIGR01976 family)
MMPQTRASSLAACRRQFPGLTRQAGGRPAIFLDGPGGSQVPQRVIAAMGDCLALHNANDGGFFATSQEIGTLMESARQGIADLLGGDDPNEIVFGPNMTTLTFAFSRAVARTWRAGDEIILSRLDHDANVAPWLLAAREVGVQVRFLEVNRADCTLCLDGLTSLLTPRTRLVAVGVASNAVGTINPVEDIVAAAHAVGALVFLDAVHAVPHLPADVRSWGCDALACSPYKFFGPHLGVLWGRRDLLEGLAAYKVRPASDELPGKWMTGTPSFEAIAGALAAVDYLEDLGRKHADGDACNRRSALAHAYELIRAYETELAGRVLGGLARRPAWRIWGIREPNALSRRVPTFGLTHERLRPDAVARFLAEQGIFAWSGNFYASMLMDALGLAERGMLRIGMLHYNTADEIDRLFEVLDQLETSRDG